MTRIRPDRPARSLRGDGRRRRPLRPLHGGANEAILHILTKIAGQIYVGEDQRDYMPMAGC